MSPNEKAKVPAGWVGGFAESDPAFGYPAPDLSSLELLDNMDNIQRLQRQQAVMWPEFSWKSQKDNRDPKRCYQMFAPDISRIGYTNEGRIYSLICPQQGVCLHSTVCLNVEVTVTGQRGWVDEPNRSFAADMTVVVKIWFGPGGRGSKWIQPLWDLFRARKLPFPADKASAIQVTTHRVGDPAQPIIPVLCGEGGGFEVPEFARHTADAWGVGYLEVGVGSILRTGHHAVDTFNSMVVDLFNMHSGNMLQLDNVLTWNVWFSTPALVETKEWQGHAKRWRDSLDADHGSPMGPGSKTKMFDGSLFTPAVNKLEELEDLVRLVKALF